MKKIIIAVLAVGLLLSPLMAMADNTTLYGKFRYSFADVGDSSGKDGIIGSDNTSLLGVKGKYGDDIQAFFHLQTGANADAKSVGSVTSTLPSGIGTVTSTSGNMALTQRFYFAGLKTQLGTIKYGRMTNAYKMPGFKLDRFYNTAGVNASGVYSAGGATYGLSGATNGFTDNALEYMSPKIAGLISAHGGLYIDDSDVQGHGYTYGAKLATGSITAGIVGATNDGATTVPGIATTDGNAIRGYAKYQAKDWSLGASYENVDATATADVNYLYIIGSYKFIDKLEAIASFGMVDTGAAEGTGGTAGVYYSVLPNTKVFALVSMASLKDDVTHAVDDSPTVFGVGFFHNFSMSIN